MSLCGPDDKELVFHYVQGRGVSIVFEGKIRDVTWKYRVGNVSFLKSV